MVLTDYFKPSPLMVRRVVLFSLCGAMLSSCELAPVPQSNSSDAQGKILRVIVNSGSKIFVTIIESKLHSPKPDTLQITTSTPNFNYGFRPDSGSLISVTVNTSADDFDCKILYKGNKIGPGSVSSSPGGASVD